MGWSLSVDPTKPDKAIAFFRKKLGLTKDEWDQLSDDAKQRAFTVAGVVHLDLVNDTWSAIDKALDEGTTFEEFVADIGEKLAAAWGGDDAPRLETIFRTNVQTAYSAGRHAAMTDPDVLAVRPMWMFDAISDSRTSDICEACDGTVLPADSDFWASHTPPLHHQCRSQLIALTSEQAQAHGGRTTAPRAAADEGFGAPPALDNWEPSKSDYPRELWAAFNAIDDDED